MGTRGKFFRDYLESLSSSIKSLISFQSEAHQDISEQDARSAAIATYFLIGELALRTNLQPVARYSEDVRQSTHDEPASARSSGDNSSAEPLSS
jgi:hypothetical protein